jgi:hypothetical protein
MMSLKRGRVRRVRSVRFVPTCLGGLDAAPLEARALTAPAFWRQPGSYTGDPDSSLDWVQAEAYGAASQPTDNTYGFGDNSTSASSVSTIMSNSGATTLTMSGLSTADAEDFDQTSPPFDPVGTYTVSLNTTNSITVTSSGAGEAVFNYFVADSNTQRFYVLADDTAAGPATIVEHASISYAAGAASVVEMGAGVGSDFGLNIGASGDNTGITSATINGSSVPVPSSGSFTDGNGNAFSYTVSSAGMEAFSAISLGTLPTVSRDMFGNIQGVSWPVESGSELRTAIGLIVDNGISSVTTHYDAHFA